MRIAPGLVWVRFETVNGMFLDTRVTTPFNAHTVKDMLARKYGTVVMVILATGSEG